MPVAVEELDLVVLDSGLASSFSHISSSCAGSSTSSSTMRPTWTLRDAREAERRQRLLDGLALRVEDARLRADQHARAHQAAARSSQDWNGSPVIRS